MKALITSISLLALVLPASAAVRTSSRSSSGPAVAGRASTSLWVAKRRRGRKGRKAPKAPPLPVKVTTPGLSEASLRQGRKTQPVIPLKPQEKLAASFSGAGKLALVFFNALPKESSERTSATVTVSIDGGPLKRVAVPTRLNKKGNLSADIGPLVSRPKKHIAKLKTGEHTADIEVLTGALGVAVRIEWYPSGHRKPAPLVFEPATIQVAAAAETDNAEVAPPPAPDLPPPVDVAKETPATPPQAQPPVDNVAAASVPAEPPAPIPAPAAASPVTDLERKIADGEIRHGLLGNFESLEIVDTREGERHPFHMVKEHQSYSVLVAGPGELTVRLHRLIDPAKKQEAQGTPYSIVILENDVVLQQLSGTTEASQNWQIDPASKATGYLLSEPKEYHLKVSANQSRLALQISEAPEGMAIRYEYVAETMSLAAMDLGFDDEEDGDLGPIGPVAPKPTVVMEVAVTEKVIIEERPGFIGLATRVGAIAPTAGGDPVPTAGVGVRFAVPIPGLTVGPYVLYLRHTLQANAPDLDGVNVRARSKTDSVPLLGVATYTYQLGRRLAVFAHFGGGVAYVRASGRALGAETVNSDWQAIAAAGGGIELNIGVGWLGIDGLYLYALSGDFEGTLGQYAVGGPGVALQYRIGI